MTSRLFRSDRWTLAHVFAATVMAAIGVAVTWPAWANIYHIASRDEESSHVFLVPVVALWMLWARRVRFRYCKPTGTILGPILVGVGWAISSFGFYHGIQSFWHGGAVIVVLGCIVAVLGKHAILRFLPVVAVLAFLVPVPGEIRLRVALPLQNWTARIEQTMFEVLGTEVVRSGNQLTINGVPVHIIEACNGLRMVFALILVSYAFSYGLPLRNSVRIVILLVSPIAAIFCNLIRILPTVWLYGNASRAVATAFHDYSGWLMLPIALLMLLGIIRLLRWAMIPVMRYTLAS
ncbi:MAG TPA: exosortase/archaeosortase family protein [Tepidisphaeraceae bacterium]|nr:exosortase/archaeosortase family protein [Tepidisphaeraceae bacterium]